MAVAQGKEVEVTKDQRKKNYTNLSFPKDLQEDRSTRPSLRSFSLIRKTRGQ
jgi:hypothetical protein